MSTNPAMVALLARRQTPAQAAHAAKRAARPERQTPTPCLCTDPIRIRGGKRSPFFVQGRHVLLCFGCAADRHRNQFVPFWAPETREDDHAAHALARGTAAIKDA